MNRVDKDLLRTALVAQLKAIAYRLDNGSYDQLPEAFVQVYVCFKLAGVDIPNDLGPLLDCAEVLHD